MCDPHIDIATFCIYADYDKDAIDRVADLYYEGATEDMDRIMIYAYAAATGFLWAVWCDYKDMKGVNYSQYAMKQYRYAKRFYRYAMQLLDKQKLNQSSSYVPSQSYAHADVPQSV
jgi:thiamine kinase-like enzyme